MFMLYLILWVFLYGSPLVLPLDGRRRFPDMKAVQDEVWSPGHGQDLAERNDTGTHWKKNEGPKSQIEIFENVLWSTVEIYPR